MIHRAYLEGALVDELIRAGFSEPQRVYRPQLEVIRTLDLDGRQKIMEEGVKTILPKFGEIFNKGPRDLFKLDLKFKNGRLVYSLRESQGNDIKNFSMEYVDEIIMENRYQEDVTVMLRGQGGKGISKMISGGHYGDKMVRFLQIFPQDCEKPQDLKRDGLTNFEATEQIADIIKALTGREN